MSTRTCPSCFRICDGYKEECIGDKCGEVPCKYCSEPVENPEELNVSYVCYNVSVANDYIDIDIDIDMEDDFPE